MPTYTMSCTHCAYEVAFRTSRTRKPKEFGTFCSSRRTG